jgi:hypothetical protein
MKNSIEELQEKILILEEENIELKKKLQPFIDEINKRKEYLERRDRIDQKINEMLYKFHNKNK